jgi:uncharacterized protein
MNHPLNPRLRDDILRVARAHGASNVCVFGSRARGEAGDDSDLDLLVDLAEGRSLLDLIGIEQDLEDIVGRPVDVLTRRELSDYLRERVLSEAVPV